MAQLCSLCKLPKKRAKFDADVRAGTRTVKDLAKKHGLALHVAQNHAKYHTIRSLPGGVVPGVPAVEVALLPPPPELKPGATDLERAEADITWLEERRRLMVKANAPDKDLATMQGQLSTARRLQAKLKGGEITSGMYARSPHFHKLWDSIVKALEAHPKALKAATEAALKVSGLGEGDL